MGEFHDLFMDAAWARLRPAVQAACAELAADDLVVDLGAGTGLGTLAVAAACPARIWAVEPSTTMRAVLLHRLAVAPELAGRVSVLAGAAPEALDRVPTPVAGVLATHVLGHLSPEERSALLGWLAAHLAADGFALLTHQPPGLDDDGAVDEVVEETRIGEHVYRATYRGSGQTFSTVYAVLDDAGRELRSHEVSGAWQVVTLDELGAAAQAHGLRVRPGPVGGTCLVTR